MKGGGRKKGEGVCRLGEEGERGRMLGEEGEGKRSDLAMGQITQLSTECTGLLHVYTLVTMETTSQYTSESLVCSIWGLFISMH